MDAEQTKISPVFITMCVLTLIGNVLLIIANLLKSGLLDAGVEKGSVGTEMHPYLAFILDLNVLSCIGSMIGAAMMLKRKSLGYTVYASSIGVHAALVLIAIIVWAMTIYMISLSVILLIYSIIPLFFFIYFRRNRKYLTR